MLPKDLGPKHAPCAAWIRTSDSQRAAWLGASFAAPFLTYSEAHYNRYPSTFIRLLLMTCL